MKKIKIFCLSFITMFLLIFSFILIPVDVHAANFWNPPESAKNFVDIDGKGVRVYVFRVYADDQGNFDYASVVAVRNYYFGDGTQWNAGGMYTVGSSYFDAESANLMTYYLSEYGSDVSIPTAERAYLYYDHDEERLKLEYRGSDYIGFWIDRFLDGYSEGYAVGYDEGQIEGYNIGRDYGYELGHDEGFSEGYTNGYIEGYDKGYDEGILLGESEAYQEGFKDGQKSKIAENNEKFYNGIEKWLVPAVITVILLGGFVTIAVRKRKEE